MGARRGVERQRDNTHRGKERLPAANGSERERDGENAAVSSRRVVFYEESERERGSIGALLFSGTRRRERRCGWSSE